MNSLTAINIFEELANLKSQISSIERRLDGVDKVNEPTPPKGWICIADFVKKYKFISPPSVYKILRDETLGIDSFNSSGRMYINPTDIIELFLKQRVKGVVMQNKFNDWVQFLPAIQEECNKIKEKDFKGLL